MKVTLILACAGKGTRAGFSKNKLLVKVNGTTVLEQTYKAFKDSKLIDEFILTASECDFNDIKSIAVDSTVVIGGQTRTESVKNALAIATGDIVLIHDGARPFVTEKIIKDCIDYAYQYGGAIPVIPTSNTSVKAYYHVLAFCIRYTLRITSVSNYIDRRLGILQHIDVNTSDITRARTSIRYLCCNGEPTLALYESHHGGSIIITTIYGNGILPDWGIVCQFSGDLN